MTEGLSPEFAVGYCRMMLEGIKREAEVTKKVFAAIPDAKSSYRPDPHARTAWELAWHLANSDIEFLDGIADLKFEMQETVRNQKPNNIAQLIRWYEENLERGVKRIAAMSPQQLLTPINFYNVFNLPAVLYLSFLNNHSIHPRGELTTYLRPMGSKVPSIYGGSYDEPFMPSAPA